MKKLFLTVLVITGLAAGANAQNGSVLLYGNLDVKSVTNNGGGQFSVNPGVGYQFSNSWTAGVEGGYNYYDNGGTGTYAIVRCYQIGAFVRKAIPLSPIFAYYTQLGVGYQHASSGTPSISADGISAYITPNIGVNLKNSFALNFGFGGLAYGLSNTNAVNNSKTFEITFGRGASFGISKNFGGATEHRHKMNSKG